MTQNVEKSIPLKIKKSKCYIFKFHVQMKIFYFRIPMSSISILIQLSL